MRGRTRYKIVKQAHTQIQRRHMVEKTEAHRKIEIGADRIAQTTRNQRRHNILLDEIDIVRQFANKACA